MTRSGSEVACSACGRLFSSYGVARHRRACGRRLRVAAGLVMWGFAIRGEQADRSNVYWALSMQMKDSSVSPTHDPCFPHLAKKTRDV